MNLIGSPTFTESKIYIRKLVKFHLFKKNEYEDVEFTGRISYNNIIVEGNLKLGVKVPYAEIDGYKFYGILPIEELDIGIFECAVDYYE